MKIAKNYLAQKFGIFFNLLLSNMIAAFIILAISLIAMFAFNEIDKKNFEAKTNKYNKEFDKKIISINKSILEASNHPAANCVEEMITFKRELESLDSTGRDYQSDYRIIYGFISFVIFSNFRIKSNNSQENYIWSPLISSWLSSSMLVDGDMRKKGGFEQSFEYNGILSEHNVEESILFLMRNVSKDQRKIEKEISRKMTTDFINMHNVISGVDSSVLFPRMSNFIKLELSSRYS